jgi:hypothetical protein
LRFKITMVVVAIVATTPSLLVWVDYRHEMGAVMAAHAFHTSEVASFPPHGPIDPATSPEAVGRRSLALHGVFGSVALIIIVLAIRTTVGVLVLRPLDRIRERVGQMERGHWRFGAPPVPQNELDALVHDFARLGVAIDALTSQLLHAERLATLALVSTKVTGQIDPQLQCIGRALATLQDAQDARTEEAREAIAYATIRIAAVSRGLGQPFQSTAGLRGHGTAPPGVLPATNRVCCMERNRDLPPRTRASQPAGCR